MVMTDPDFVQEILLRVDKLHHEKCQLEEEMTALKAQLATLQEGQAVLEGKCQNNTRDTYQPEIHLTMIRDLNAQVEELTQSLAEKIASANSLDPANKALADENEDLKASLKRLNTEFAQCIGEKEALRANLQIQTAQFQQEADARIRDLRAFESRKAELHAQNCDASAQIQHLKQAITEQQAAYEEMSSKASSLWKENRELNIKAEDAKTALHAAGVEMEQLRNDKATVDTYCQEYFEKMREQERLIGEQQAELENLLASNTKFRETEEELRAQVVTLTEQLALANETKLDMKLFDATGLFECKKHDTEVQTMALEGSPLTPLSSRATSVSTQTEPPVQRVRLVVREPEEEQSPTTLTQRSKVSFRVPITVSAEDAAVSPARQAFLDRFPAIDIPHIAHHETATFSRPYLSAHLGGGMQGVIGTFDQKKPRRWLSERHNLLGCIYPQRHLNPWLPQKPGDHGYLFLGLRGPGKDHERFRIAEDRALFVCEKAGWKYYGQYTVQRSIEGDLTVDEWNTFSDEFKDGDNGYCAMTLNKSMGGSAYEQFKKAYPSQHSTRLAEVRAQYDAGELHVPCISLQCIGYNADLVDALRCSGGSRSSVAGPSSSASVALRTSKRRRKDSDHEPSEISDDSDDDRPLRRMHVARQG